MKHRKRKQKKLIDDLIVAFGRSDRIKATKLQNRIERATRNLREASQ